MFDKNLVLSYCREKVEAAHWASKQLSQKKDPAFADAMASSANTGRATAYNAIASMIKNGVTSQSGIANECVRLLAEVKNSAEKNRSLRPCIEIVLNGESFVGQAEAISDISDHLSQKFFEK